MVLGVLMYILVIVVDKNFLLGYHVVSSCLVIMLAHLNFQIKYFKSEGDVKGHVPVA